MTKENIRQSGRSMVEMLGVLAIIGVLSVGGIAGYKSAMQAHLTNEINNNFKLAMVEYGALPVGGEKTIEFSDTMTATMNKNGGGFDNGNSVTLKVKTSHLDKSSIIKIGQNMYELKKPYSNFGSDDYLYHSYISGDKFVCCYMDPVGSCSNGTEESCTGGTGVNFDDGINDYNGYISITLLDGA